MTCVMTRLRLSPDTVLREPDRARKAAQMQYLAQQFRVQALGIQDRFGESGEYMALMAKYGISAEAIESRARTLAGRGFE